MIVCPASANGIVGFKPTVGLVSRQGIVPISHSQDTAGPMTRSVADAAIVLDAIAGADAADPATGAVSPPIHLSTTFARRPDGSLPQGFLYARSDNPTRHALEDALAPLEGGAVALAFASGMAATTAVAPTINVRLLIDCDIATNVRHADHHCQRSRSDEYP